jgi:hypothetical protein
MVSVADAVDAGGEDGALAHRLRVAGRHAQAVVGERLAQRRLGRAQLLAAALMLPSRSASWKARSASARSARKRLGCQPTTCWAYRAH